MADQLREGRRRKLEIRRQHRRERVPQRVHAEPLVEAVEASGGLRTVERSPDAALLNRASVGGADDEVVGPRVQADESALYHHYELNYTPPDTESGRRLARR